jgi:2Fe-2S ferredoxin
LIRPTYTVRVEPEGLELEVKDGQTIFRVANEAGLHWPTRCGGASTCTLCTMLVIEGEDRLSKPSDDELFLCGPIARRLEIDPRQLRMACAAKVRGPLVVHHRYALGQEVIEDDAWERA